MGKKILVADDSRTMRRAFQIAFAKEDVELLLAEEGGAAVEMARQLGPDLVLADHKMPDKTGYEVCDEIKSDPRLGHIRVVICASNQDPFDAQRGGKADGHILKPFDTQKLIELAQELLAQEPAGVPAAAPRPAAAPVAPRPPSAPAATPAPTAPAAPTAASAGPTAAPRATPRPVPAAAPRAPHRTRRPAGSAPAPAPRAARRRRRARRRRPGRDATRGERRGPPGRSPERL